jgi:hypothetical protein
VALKKVLIEAAVVKKMSLLQVIYESFWFAGCCKLAEEQTSVKSLLASVSKSSVCSKFLHFRVIVDRL